MNELEKKLNKIKKIFNIEKILNMKSDTSYIQKYYKINQLSYTVFHSRNFIHCGISRNGRYKKSDLLEAVKVVEKQIKNHNAKNVLEIGTGRGANSAYLAKTFPEVKFNGIDISDGQLFYAYKYAHKLKNFFPSKGDYNDLSAFENSSLDIVFGIETLCYSENKSKVLGEVRRVLRNNGLFLILDAYRAQNDKYSPEELIALKIIEKGMAVNEVESYENFRAKIEQSNFKIIEEENISQYVIPTLKRLEIFSKIFFLIPFVTRLLKLILPKEFTYNGLSGYLIVPAVERKLYIYMITILNKI